MHHAKANERRPFMAGDVFNGPHVFDCRESAAWPQYRDGASRISSIRVCAPEIAAHDSQTVTRAITIGEHKAKVNISRGWLSQRDVLNPNRRSAADFLYA